MGINTICRDATQLGGGHQCREIHSAKLSPSCRYLSSQIFCRQTSDLRDLDGLLSASGRRAWPPRNLRAGPSSPRPVPRPRRNRYTRARRRTAPGRRPGRPSRRRSRRWGCRGPRRWRSRSWTTSRRWSSSGWREFRWGRGSCTWRGRQLRQRCRCGKPGTRPRGRRSNLGKMRVDTKQQRETRRDMMMRLRTVIRHQQNEQSRKKLGWCGDGAAGYTLHSTLLHWRPAPVIAVGMGSNVSLYTSASTQRGKLEDNYEMSPGPHRSNTCHCCDCLCTERWLVRRSSLAPCQCCVSATVDSGGPQL